MTQFVKTGALGLCVLLAACSGEMQKETPPVSAAAEAPASGFMADCSRLKRKALRIDSLLLQQTEMDAALARQAVVAFTEFASGCEADSLAPVYLIKTAQVARASDNVPQAKVALDQCIAAYPNFKDRPAALFLLAQLYDEVSYLNDEQKARELYQKIIDEHPKSPWASSAKGAILFLGKSDREILEELKKKQR